MKKAIIVVLSVLMFGAALSAQPRTIGLRLGYGAELSYQHDLGSANFLEADLGLVGKDFYLSGLYDFSFAQSGIFSFYGGPGATLGFWDNGDNTEISFGIAGQIGTEVDLEPYIAFPLRVSLDWRPTFGLVGNTGFHAGGFALGVRYVF